MAVAAHGSAGEDPAPPSRSLGSRFWALWAANTCSGLGDGLNAAALPLLAATLTHRPVLIAGVLVAQRVPWLIVGLPAGAHADRVDQPRLMRRMDVVRAVMMLGLTLVVAVGRTPLVLIYLLALVMGTCDPFFSAANQATLPAVVPGELLARGNGLLEVGQNTTEQAIGPALGGAAFAVARAVPFGVDAVSFIGSAALLLGLGRGAPPRRDRGDAGSGSHLWADTRGGLAWYRRSRALVVVTATVAVLAFSQAMVSAILVLFALDRLHVGDLGYGVFLGVAALGNVIGGLLADPILRRWRTAPVTIGAIVMSAGGYLATSAVSSPVLAATFLGIEGVAVVIGSVATISFRQRAAPAEMQARVATVWRTAIWGAIPLGALAGGAVGTLAGVRAPLLVAAGLQLAVAVVVARPLLRLLPGPTGHDPVN